MKVILVASTIHPELLSIRLIGEEYSLTATGVRRALTDHFDEGDIIELVRVSSRAAREAEDMS